MSVVIKVENLSKQYRLGEVGTGSMKDDIKRWRYKMMGKEDPFLTIGEENDRTVKANSKYVWALKDINFQVQQGEILGIIGRNGAGKSTLLKILSRTTGPTKGTLKMKGRVASLLEVGTGFHGELSGRENIYLNGAIMGMRRDEITRKLDEIIDFAGVEKYIDTPVKRYSSGMYVRLAFGVAAHLEPDIMIVDEVLAVGDAEFQKKALGKMKEVSSEGGRTVLFVSHNMISVKNLCTSVMFLQNGRISEIGKSENIIDSYLALSKLETQMLKQYLNIHEAPGNDSVRMKRIEVCPLYHNEKKVLDINTPINIEFEFWNKVTDREVNLSLHLFSSNQECVFNVWTEAKLLKEGLYKGVCHIPAPLLNDGIYSVSIMVVGERSYAVHNFEHQVIFEVNEKRRASNWHGKVPGIVRPKLNFDFEPITELSSSLH
jgi:lipopolysaccharide transport system ATP-binding protein